MGNWIITIKGHGMHHNNLEGDADYVAREAIASLIDAGSTVDSATIELTGGDYVSNGHEPENLLPVAEESTGNYQSPE